MPLLDWKDEFAVGVESVDFEHQELIALINDLHGSLAEPQSEVTVPEFLGEIYAKISAHFAHEERLMRAQGYDEYADHKADHERLLDEMGHGFLGITHADGWPAAIPVNFVYLDERVYFHGATEGQKMGSLASDPRVSFTVVRDLSVA